MGINLGKVPEVKDEVERVTPTMALSSIDDWSPSKAMIAKEFLFKKLEGLNENPLIKVLASPWEKFDDICEWNDTSASTLAIFLRGFSFVLLIFLMIVAPAALLSGWAALPMQFAIIPLSRYIKNSVKKTARALVDFKNNILKDIDLAKERLIEEHNSGQTKLLESHETSNIFEEDEEVDKLFAHLIYKSKK